MDKIVDLISKMLTPEHNWGDFARKTLSTLLVASIGAYSFNTYQRLQRSHWEDLPLHTAIDEGTKLDQVNSYLSSLIQSDSSLLSVWLYSWPNARSLIPVTHAGEHINPLPLGYFIDTDAQVIGELALQHCSCLKRPGKKLLACPIFVENDAWGMILFHHHIGTDRPEGYKHVYAALAHKLSNIIYHKYYD